VHLEQLLQAFVERSKVLLCIRSSSANSLAVNDFPAVVPSLAESKCEVSRSTSTSGSVRPL
jgi:hypothetical protein